MARRKGGGASFLIGLIILFLTFIYLYPGFHVGNLTSLPSLEFLVVFLAGLVLFLRGAARLTEGLGPP